MPTYHIYATQQATRTGYEEWTFLYRSASLRQCKAVIANAWEHTAHHPWQRFLIFRQGRDIGKAVYEESKPCSSSTTP